MFGLNFGELFIVGFVFITVVGAPYAGTIGERLFGWLMPKGATVDDERTGDRGQAVDLDEEASPVGTTTGSETAKGSKESGG